MTVVFLYLFFFEYYFYFLMIKDLFFLNNGQLYSISMFNNSLSYIGSSGPSNQGENILSAGKDNENNGLFSIGSRIIVPVAS